MALEIEHKYLVVGDSYKEMAGSRLEIRQGYLNRLPERTVRVRTKNNHGYLTVKGKNFGDVREEFEYEIPYDDAFRMLQLCEPPLLEKTRFIVDYDGHTWEVDEYHGTREGLVVAEIELPDSATPYALPPFVGENVTGNVKYYNSNL